MYSLTTKGLDSLLDPVPGLTPTASVQYPLHNFTHPRCLPIYRQRPQELENPERRRSRLASWVGGGSDWRREGYSTVVNRLNLHDTGLENYQPDDSRETRLLGRFPMRNRFISDWIYEKTGKRRNNSWRQTS